MCRRESLPEIRRALSGVFPASGAGPFSLSLTAPGFFLRQGRASLWAGVALPEELTALHRAEGDILRRVCGAEGEWRLQAPRDPGTRARGFPGLS